MRSRPNTFQRCSCGGLRGHRIVRETETKYIMICKRCAAENPIHKGVALSVPPDMWDKIPAVTMPWLRNRMILPAMPERDEFVKGARWIGFKIEGLDAEKYAGAQASLLYMGVRFQKIGWNGETGFISYKERAGSKVAA